MGGEKEEGGEKRRGKERKGAGENGEGRQCLAASSVRELLHGGHTAPFSLSLN